MIIRVHRESAYVQKCGVKGDYFNILFGIYENISYLWSDAIIFRFKIMYMDINKMMPMDVILSVINFVGITEDEFGTRSRHQPVVISKVIVTYCFLYMGLSNTFIGRIILKDHSTITHYKKLIRDDLFIRRWIIRYKAHMESLGWYIPGLDRWDGDGLGVRRYGKT